MPTGHELAMALRGAYLAMHRQTDAALARLGVTADQFVLLSVLARGEATTQRELARRTSSDPNTVRAMLLLLEGRKLIVRGQHPTDARARTVSLTGKGRRVYEQLWNAGESVREQLMEAVGVEDAEILFDMLGRITRVMSDTAERTETVPSKVNHGR